MENKKMRCHFSIIFEKTGRSLVLLFFYLIAHGSQFIRNFREMEAEELRSTMLIFGAFLFIYFIIITYQFFVWRNTTIRIDSQTIIVEQNTLNKKINTFGIRNISNINLEQNLFEQIIGTSKVKTDTNSLSTASTTDITILLSKKKAMEFKEYILSFMEEDRVENPEEPEDFEQINAITYTTKEVFFHCLYSFSIVSFMIFAGVAAVVVLFFWKSEPDLSPAQFLHRSIGSSVAVLLFIATNAFSFVKYFFDFHGFRVSRHKNRIFLRYGCLKKKQYDIPVEKINAVKIMQPAVSWLFQKYQVEIETVGIGDEEKERSKLLLACDRQKLLEAMEELLPEYWYGCEKSTRKVTMFRQSVLYFFHKLPKLILIPIVCFLVSNLEKYTLGYIPEWIWGAGTISLVVLYMIAMVLNYFSCSYYMGEDLLVASHGSFQKTTVIIPYAKIQYIRIQQSPLTKRTGLSSANAFILAPLLNQVVSLPYTKEEIFEEIAKKVIQIK